MTLYIFRCVARPRMYGATRYETGSNLPKDQSSGGWKFAQRIELPLRGSQRIGIDPEMLRRQIKKNGWCVWDESPRESSSGTADSKAMPRRQPLTPVVETAASEVAPAPITKMAPPATAEVIPEEATHVVDTPSARHQVVWFDIPVRDLDRALRFYSAVLGSRLKKEQAGPGVAIAVLPHAEGSIGGSLVQTMDSKPSESGPLLYLNTNGRLDEALNAVESHGGKVLSAMHSIEPFGFRAIVLDSEGNRVALHSM